MLLVYRMFKLLIGSHKTMSSPDKLFGVNLKIERAKKHIVDLEAAIRAFGNTRPHEIGTKHDPQTNRVIYYVAKVGDIPSDIPLIAGDAIQCLRSALDQLAYVMFFSCGGTGKPNRVYFPIADNAAKYKAELPGKIQGMSQIAIDAFNALEPYKGGKGNDLWVIHWLCNTDKHRALITAAMAFRGVDIIPLFKRLFGEALDITAGHVAHDFGDMGVVIRAAYNRCPLKAGDELFIDAPDAEVNQDIKFAFDIAVNESEIGEPQPVLVLFKNLVDVVNDIVAQLSRLV